MPRVQMTKMSRFVLYLLQFYLIILVLLLLVKFLNPAQTVSWVVVALSSTFAGNLITIGSIANLIVIESAREYGVNIRFGEHARAGVPITIFSLLTIILWLG